MSQDKGGEINLSGEQILKIIRDKDDYKNVVEIKENAKGEATVSVKIRDDADDPKGTVDKAIEAYNHAKNELLKEAK